MLAAILNGTGLDALDVGAKPVPVPAADEVLVKVSTVGLNQLDLNVINGVGPGAAAKLPRVLGIDPAGEIVGQGDDVPENRIGERVVVKPNISCGECPRCLAGEQADCPAQNVVGVHTDGGAAQYVAVPSRNAFAIGDLEFAVATAAVHSVPIALHAINAAGGIRSGDTVLVTGANGAVGWAAVQLALSFRGSVFAASRSTIPALAGVTRIVFSTADDVREQLRSIHAPGFNVAIDATGHGGVMAAALHSLGWKGRMAICSASVSPELTIDARDFYLKRKSLTGAASANYGEVAEAINLVRTGSVTPRIAERIPLENIRDGYRRLSGSGSSGKVIIDVP